jgi:hypothetical protein
MSTPLDLRIQAQPDDVTCGPTCLQAVYDYYGDPISIEAVIDEVEPLENRGTMAVLLAHHALERGFRATLYAYNLDVFDPSWFSGTDVDLRERLEQQAAVKPSAMLQFVTTAYLRFLALGGTLDHRELNPELLVSLLARGPVLTGLSATYLYGCAREIEEAGRLCYDDLRGEATGHFVVLYGYHPGTREVLVADPLRGNPLSGDHQHYAVGIDRLLGAIMLGVLTYDGNLLLLEPAEGMSRSERPSEGVLDTPNTNGSGW